MPVPTEGGRVDVAVARAVEAFWHKLAEQYPEITTGDEPPSAYSFEQAAGEVAREWIERNGAAVAFTHDQLAAFGRLAHEASIGAFGITHAMTCRQGRPADGIYGVAVDSRDMVVRTSATDDANSDTPGTERTFVAIIGVDGTVRQTHEDH